MSFLGDLRFVLAATVLLVGGCTKSADQSQTAQASPGDDASRPSVAADTSPNGSSGLSPATSPGAATGRPAPTVPKAPPIPSAEQLAKWAIPRFEPLQLLSCNDGFGGPAVVCFALSPDGKQYALGGGQLTLGNIQDASRAADLLKDYTPDQIARPINAVAFSSDGQWIAGGDNKGKVRLWNCADHQEAIAIDAHESFVRKLAFSPDSKLLATTSYSGEVKLWQLPEGKPLKSLNASEQSLTALAFVSNTQLAVAAAEVSLWNVETGAKVKTLTTEPVIDATLCVSSDRRLLAYDDPDSSVRFWDVVGAKPTGAPLQAAGAHRIALSSDAKWIATSTQDEIRIWDAASGNTVQVIDVSDKETPELAWLPESHALVVATKNGRVRIWGAPAAAEKLGLETIQHPASSPPSAERRSLTSVQLKRLIDLRSFPRLPGAIPHQDDFAAVSYMTPASPAEAELFYRYLLTTAGWKELPSTPETQSFEFQKDGCRLNVTFPTDDARAPGAAEETLVMLSFYGNYDVRWAPKYSAEARLVHESFSSATYRIKGELTDVEAGLITKLHEAGWTGYTRLMASSVEMPDSRTLTMLQGGSELTVSISRESEADGQLMVQTFVQPKSISLPLPSDSGWIEFHAPTDLQAVINTKMDLPQTIAFFDKNLAADGWSAGDKGRRVEDEQAGLPYFHGQQDVYLRLEKLAAGGTRIVVGDAARTSWQLKKLVAEKSDKPGIEAADFSLPAGAAAVKFDVDAKEIRFEAANTSAPKLGEKFIQQMEAAGWQRDGAGSLDNDFTFLTYTQQKVEIQFRARTAGTKTSATISGDGLLWSKPLPAAPERVSYETWLRRNRLPAGLEHLDQFLTEMHKIRPATGK